jgi:type I restriction enzyme S subunit
MKNGTVAVEQLRRTSNEIAHAYRRSMLAEGDLLVSIRGHVGRTSFVPRAASGANLTQDTARVAVSRNAEAKYVRRFIESPAARRWLDQHTKGVAVTGINLGDLRQLPVPLPPLPEQRRIAEILDRAEALRAKRRAAIAQLDELTQAIFVDMFGDPATNPKGWPESELGELCERVIDCPHSTPVYVQRTTPYICVRSSDIQDSELALTNAKYMDYSEYSKRTARGKPQRGDIIYCREGARFGNVARLTDDTQICLGQRMMLFRPRATVGNSEYLWAFLSSPAGYRRATNAVEGSAAPHVNIRSIVKFRLPTPPIIKQRDFSRRVISVDSLKFAHRTALSELDALFATLQHRAFRGEL